MGRILSNSQAQELIELAPFKCTDECVESNT